MPSRQLETRTTAPFGVGSSLLKRHKVLPHPQQVSDDSLSDSYPTPPSSKAHPLSIDTAFSSTSGSQNSSPRTLKHASRRIGLPDLPPTPPTHSRQSSVGTANITAPVEALPVQELQVRTPAQALAPSTPPNQQSPPTPDITPPRIAPQTLAVRAPLGKRYPSSRADSFKTAPEFPESSDEDEMSTVRPILPSTIPSEADTTTLSSGKEKLIGLGLLGLDSGTDRTPSPRVIKGVRNEFGTFDGEWSSSQGEVSEVEKEWDDNLMRNVTVRRRRGQNRISHIYDDSPLSREVLDDDLVAPTNATLFLRDFSLEDTPVFPQEEPTTPTPTRQSPEPVRWTKMEQPSIPSTPDLRRVSAMSSKSGNSTVVEAIVVEAAPQGPKTLRHTKKYNGLRDFSSDSSTTQHSRTVSTTSLDPKHRLVHSNKVRDLRHYSLGSANTASTSSSGRSRREILKSGGIPVVVIPERRSSVKPTKTPSLRSTSSRRTAHKRSLSLSSVPLSNSSKSHELGYFDLPTKKVRRMSETASSHSTRTMDFPPVIPARRSSLSAPTSRNASVAGSRTGSLTAESLKAHNLLHAAANKSNITTQDLRSAGSLNVPQTPGRAGDQHGDPRKLSAQPTPFSQYSYETSGTAAEVSEAMAVSLFPHQNKSILMVQHSNSNTSPSSSLPRTTEPVKEKTKLTNGTVNVIPVTPPQPNEPVHQEDSPFRNPREPPQPPAIKFIPPTPGVLTPAAEADRQLGAEGAELGQSPDQPKLKRGFSLRRAIANRRHSETFMPRTFSLKRFGSVSKPQTTTISSQTGTANGNIEPLYPTVTDQPSDSSKLHPFWRPARFWDDLEDERHSDDELDEDYTDGVRDAYPRIDNRPRPPMTMMRSLSGSLKKTFAILPNRDDYYATTPYHTERRVVRRTSNGQLRVVTNRGSIETLRKAREIMNESGRNGEGKRPKGNLGGAWKGLSRRLSERKDREKEKRQDRIRQNISGPKDVVDDRDYVLRSGRHNGHNYDQHPVHVNGVRENEWVDGGFDGEDLEGGDGFVFENANDSRSRNNGVRA